MNRTGLLAWFVARRSDDGVPMVEVRRALDALESDRNTIREFARPIHSMSAMADFWAELEATRDRMSQKRALNRFLPFQKQFFSADLGARAREGHWLVVPGKMPRPLAGLPARTHKGSTEVFLSEQKMLRDLAAFPGADRFFGSVKRYTNRDQLMGALCSQMYLAPGDYDEVMRRVRKAGATARFASREGGVVVVDVDYRQLCRLASHSNWCHLGRASWDNIVKSGLYVQWVVFLLDFSDKYSMMGATTTALPSDGSFMQTETRFLDDTATSVAELDGLMEARGVPPGFLRDCHFRVLSERFSRMRSWDAVPLPALLAAGVDRAEVARRKGRYSVADLPAIRGAMAGLLPARAVEEVERQRRRILADFRAALPAGEFYSRRAGKTVPSFRDELDALPPESKERAEDLVVSMHGHSLYPALMAGVDRDYRSLGELLDVMARARETVIT